MDKILIRGGKRLVGEISIGGSKNAALPLMAASLLSEGTLEIVGLPDVDDIKAMAKLLLELGVQVEYIEPTGSNIGVCQLSSSNIRTTKAPYDIVRKMRASVLVLGPLLTRFGHARVSLPGGCAIGTRPVDLHLEALKEMGAMIQIEGGYIEAHVDGSLRGANLTFPKITVGGTENVLMAAVLARGDTVINNAAREPEVTDLAICLKSMGAEIEGIGTSKLKVFGVRSLHGTSHKVIPDRIETGTYAIAASITGGDLVLRNVQKNNNQGLLCALSKAGVETSELDGGLRVSSKREKLKGINLTTEPFPGFPTDMQAQFMALMCLANGKSQITESIFENRFMHVPELVRMGANISVSGASALVEGVPKMSAAQVMATDLRASVSLILAGLAIDGETLLNRVYHLDRGYERLEEKLAACGAEIKRVK